jgi:hypothetical protein
MRTIRGQPELVSTRPLPHDMRVRLAALNGADSLNQFVRSDATFRTGTDRRGGCQAARRQAARLLRVRGRFRVSAYSIPSERLGRRAFDRALPPILRQGSDVGNKGIWSIGLGMPLWSQSAHLLGNNGPETDVRHGDPSPWLQSMLREAPARYLICSPYECRCKLIEVAALVSGLHACRDKRPSGV